MKSSYRTLFLPLYLILLLQLTGCGGSSQPNPEITPRIQFSADTNNIVAGQNVTLSWSTTNATSVTITGISGTLSLAGTAIVTPTETTTYTAKATGSGGTTTASVTVAVLGITFSASPSSIVAGHSSTLTWTSHGASTVEVQPGLGNVALSGSAVVTPAQTTTYTATAKNVAGNSTSATATVTVLPAGGLQSNIKHIVFLIQENRSFDNYFGSLGAYRVARGLPADVDGLDLSNLAKYGQQDAQGNIVLPYHQRSVCVENTSPSWNPSHNAYNNGLMDGFVRVKEVPSVIDPYYHRVMGYYDDTESPYYYELATQFATSDRFFSSVMAGTIANRMYLFAGTSAGHIYSEDQPPPGGWPIKTIFEVLRDHNISWRYYYQDNSIFLAQFEAWQDPTITTNVWPISDWYDTLAAGTADQDLASVVFIEHAATSEEDEHPGENMQNGQATVAKMLNALMQSNAWRSSVFILSHDEFGGLYDHVAPYAVPAPDDIPPIPTITPTVPGDFTLSGFRLPLLVVSPWVKPHFVSHRPREFTSILKLIEVRFGLPSMTARDAAADDMTEFFDFSQPAWLVPPALPPQPTDGICDWSLEVTP